MCFQQLFSGSSLAKLSRCIFAFPFLAMARCYNGLDSRCKYMSQTNQAKRNQTRSSASFAGTLAALSALVLPSAASAELESNTDNSEAVAEREAASIPSELDGLYGPAEYRRPQLPSSYSLNGGDGCGRDEGQMERARRDGLLGNGDYKKSFPVAAMHPCLQDYHSMTDYRLQEYVRMNRRDRSTLRVKGEYDYFNDNIWRELELESKGPEDIKPKRGKYRFKLQTRFSHPSEIPAGLKDSFIRQVTKPVLVAGAIYHTVDSGEYMPLVEELYDELGERAIKAGLKEARKAINGDGPDNNDNYYGRGSD